MIVHQSKKEASPNPHALKKAPTIIEKKNTEAEKVIQPPPKSAQHSTASLKRRFRFQEDEKRARPKVKQKKRLVIIRPIQTPRWEEIGGK
jgi:hypothetical protein